VSARGNYVNGQNPPTCFNGSFDLTGYVTTLPSSFRGVGAEVGRIDGEGLRALGVTANPMTGAAGIRFMVLRPVGRISVAVFDVAGRMVKEFPRAEYPVGEQVVTWDGRTSQGELTPNGLYFVRISSERAETQAFKVFVTH
jgi:hypothetical protein